MADGDPILVGKESYGTHLTKLWGKKETGFVVRVGSNADEGGTVGGLAGISILTGSGPPLKGVISNVGVFGRSDAKIDCGVYGTSDSGMGVEGRGGNIGVSGYSGTGFGVQGCSAESWGVLGISQAKYGVGVAGSAPGSGIYGESVSGLGVNGHSGSRTGVFGWSSSVDENGDPINSGVGVWGESPHGVGVYGKSVDGLAGQFEGPVVIKGDFTVIGGAKSAAVWHPDGSTRLLYTVESPESWFEDFGTGKLVNGRAEVALDKDFMKLVARSAEYHVFLTPRGDSQGLFVKRQKIGSFDVAEQKNGKSEIFFSYRVVAKRKDIPGIRLQKIAVPERLVASDRLVSVAHKKLRDAHVITRRLRPPTPRKRRKSKGK